MRALLLIPFLLAGTGLAAAADIAAGERLWLQTHPADNGQPRSCATCHGKDPRLPGRHARTRKPIDAMAPTVNNERFTDEAKVEKWFKRNCKWTWGRECTAQEKQQIRAWLHSF